MIGLTDIEYILETVESGILEPPPIKPLPHDRWCLASAMQKAIRFGNEANALQYAANLYHADRRMLWRRLEVIVLEDIGIGDGGTVAEVLAIAASSPWRRKVGDLKAVLYCVRRMAKSLKSRACTHMYFMAEVSPACKQARDHFPGMMDDELAAIALNREQHPWNRALALWLLAGTDRYPSDRLVHREGNLDLAMDVMADMNCPYAVKQSCILHLKRSRWPLALLTPLVFEAYEQDEYETLNNHTPHTQTVNGLPLYALDQYTRAGKQAIRLWQKECQALFGYKPKELECAVFQIEGGVLDRERLDSPLMELKEEATDAIFLASGIIKHRQYQIMHDAGKNLGLLNEIRKSTILKN